MPARVRASGGKTCCACWQRRGRGRQRRFTDSLLGQTVILMGAVFAVSGLIWAVKFFVLSGVLFADRTPAELDVPAVPEW